MSEGANSSENPTMTEAIKSVVWSILVNLHTALPGVVESYTASTQKASVKPQLIKNFVDGSELSLPVVNNVPVIFPRTATASLTFPVSKGDKVLLIFAERSLDEYLSLGREVKPEDRRKFDLSDAIAIPGFYDFSSPGPSNGDDVELVYKNSKVVIKSNGQVAINDDGLTVD